MAIYPEDTSIHPKLERSSMDVLKRALQTLRLKPKLCFRSYLWSPWGVEDNIPNKTVFHLIEDGNCWLQTPASPEPIPLSRGDFIVISGASRYKLSTEIEVPAIPFSTVLELDREAWKRQMLALRPPETTLLCGEFQPDNILPAPLMQLLPPLIIIRNEEGRAVHWLNSPLELITSETKFANHGHETVISRLMDIIFIMVMRYWINSHSDGLGGWLNALVHPTIGPVLQRIHQQPEAPWTLDSLAQAAFMSRSIFAEKFTDIVQMAPMRYVTHWRMQLATSWLVDEPYMSLGDIANRVGYTSAFAFSKAYKRMMGMSPSEMRSTGSQTADDSSFTLVI